MTVSADFTGLIGSGSNLLALDEFQSISLEHRTGWEFLTGNTMLYSDKASDQISFVAGFVGPMGRFETTLNIIPKAAADFIGLIGRSEAILNVGKEIESAHFTGLIGNGEALLELVYPLDLAADGFVGPMGFTSVQLRFFELNAGFTGPRGHMDALVFGDGAASGEFIGLIGNGEVELKNNIEVSAEFIGIMGGGCAQLGVDERTLWADFSGPMGFASAGLENSLALNIGFVGPRGNFNAELDAPMPISADFVGPIGNFEAFISDDLLRVDAFFRGPRSHMDAELTIELPATEATISYSYKKYGAALEANTEVNSTITFFLIQL